jgi:hypothetical protein
LKLVYTALFTAACWAGSAAAQEPSVEVPESEPTDLERYQDCFQKMIDAGASDNAFMKKCLGLPDKPAPKKGPHGERAFLQKDDVQEVVLTNISGITECYVKLLAQVKDLGVKPEGSVDLRFDVTPAGAVEGLGFEPTSITDVGLLGCVREKVKAWAFPKTANADKVNVKLSFRLHVKEGKGGQTGIAALAKGYPKLSGPGYGLSTEDLLAVFRKNSYRVRACYDELLKRKPGSSGNVAVDLVVSPYGRVTKVSYRELTVGDDAFKSCATAQLKKWKFPKPRGGEPVPVKYPPFVFAPKG